MVDDETVRASASHHVVLPRFLRRPVRVLRRLDWKLPRHFGAKGLVALFLTTAVSGVVSGGHGMTVVSAATAWAGFAIENVKITGQSETSEVDVLAALDIGQYPSLLTLDVEAARARIETLPWVKQATLKKLFPDTVEIAVVERDPYAIWQHAGEVSLIDEAGKTITDRIDERYATLPRVVGTGAAEKAVVYTALVGNFPTIARQARAGILVSEDRWTIVLESGIELMLPVQLVIFRNQTVLPALRDIEISGQLPQRARQGRQPLYRRDQYRQCTTRGFQITIARIYKQQQ